MYRLWRFFMSLQSFEIYSLNEIASSVCVPVWWPLWFQWIWGSFYLYMMRLTKIRLRFVMAPMLPCPIGMCYLFVFVKCNTACLYSALFLKRILICIWDSELLHCDVHLLSVCCSFWTFWCLLLPDQGKFNCTGITFRKIFHFRNLTRLVNLIGHYPLILNYVGENIF